MVHTEASVLIARPIEQVFAVATDFSRSHEWRQGMTKSGVTSGGPVGIGTTYDWVVRFGGSTMDLGGRVIAWEPPRVFGWKAAGGPFPVSGGLRFEVADGGTRVTTYSDSQPTGFMRIGTPLVRWIGARQYRSELGRLKAILEGAASVA